MNEKTIFSMRLAFYLMDKGFKPTKVLPQTEIPQYNKWVFEDSQELRLAITEYTYKFCRK